VILDAYLMDGSHKGSSQLVYTDCLPRSGDEFLF